MTLPKSRLFSSKAWNTVFSSCIYAQKHPFDLPMSLNHARWVRGWHVISCRGCKGVRWPREGQEGWNSSPKSLAWWWRRHVFRAKTGLYRLNTYLVWAFDLGWPFYDIALAVPSLPIVVFPRIFGAGRFYSRAASFICFGILFVCADSVFFFAVLINTVF